MSFVVDSQPTGPGDERMREAMFGCAESRPLSAAGFRGVMSGLARSAMLELEGFTTISAVALAKAPDIAEHRAGNTPYERLKQKDQDPLS